MEAQQRTPNRIHRKKTRARHGQSAEAQIERKDTLKASRGEKGDDMIHNEMIHLQGKETIKADFSAETMEARKKKKKKGHL